MRSVKPRCLSQSTSSLCGCSELFELKISENFMKPTRSYKIRQDSSPVTPITKKIEGEKNVQVVSIYSELYQTKATAHERGKKPHLWQEMDAAVSKALTTL